MGQDRTPSVVQGLLVPFDDLTFWSSESSYTEASKRPGDPVCDRASYLDMRAAGDEQTEAVTAQVVRAGVPGAGFDGAGIVWHDETDSAWRGWEVPQVSFGWEPIQMTDGAAGSPDGTIIAVRHPHAITLADGTILVVAEASLSSTPGGRVIRVWSRDPDTGAWALAPGAIYSATAPSQDLYPCLLVLPSGRVLLFHWLIDEDTLFVQVQAWYSDDSGQTWTLYREHVLDEAVDTNGSGGSGATGYNLRRLRAGYYAGGIALFADLVANDTDPAYREVIRQWASYDLGATFAYVDQMNGLATMGGNGGLPDVATLDDGLLVVFYSLSGFEVDSFKLSNIAEPMTGAAMTYAQSANGVLDASGQFIDEADVALAVDDDGVAYVFASSIGSSSVRAGVTRTLDGGQTWECLADNWVGGGSWYYTYSTSAYPQGYSVTMQRGRAVVLHGMASTTTIDYSLAALYLGGYSTLTLPDRYEVGSDNRVNRVCYADETWLPFDLPDATTWSTTGAGTAGLDLVTGALDITTSSTSKYYDQAPTATLTEGYIVRFALAVISGGALTSNDISIRLDLSDGSAHDYSLGVNLTGTGFRVSDLDGGPAVIGDVSVDTTGDGIELIVAIADGHVSTWYRRRDLDEDHIWQAGPSGALTDGGASVVTANLIRWGNVGSATAESHWWEVQFVAGSATGLQMATGFTSPDDLWPRPLSPLPVYMAHGLSLYALSGPGADGEVWTVEPSSEYAVELAEPTTEPSPRRGWRSVADGTAMELAWSLADGSAAEMLDTDLLGVALFEVNVGTVEVLGYDVSTSAWVSLASVSTSDGANALRWVADGRVVVPDTIAGVTTPYLLRGDYDGGSFGDSIAGWFREVARQTEGRFGPPPTGEDVRRAVVRLASAPPASSSVNGQLRAPRLVAVIPLGGAKYSGFKVRLPAQTTWSGDYRIGSVVLGPVLIWGTKPSWGRAIELTDGHEEFELRDKRRAYFEAAPQLRKAEIAWSDGVDTTQAVTSETPDYVYGSTATGRLPVATPADLPWLLSGLYRQAGGPALPVVYLPHLDVQAGVQTLISREEMMLARVASSIRRETVMGDEYSDEVVRIATVALEEVG